MAQRYRAQVIITSVIYLFVKAIASLAAILDFSDPLRSTGVSVHFSNAFAEWVHRVERQRETYQKALRYVDKQK